MNARPIGHAQPHGLHPSLTTRVLCAALACFVLVLELAACTSAPEPTRLVPTQNLPPTSQPVALQPTPTPAPGGLAVDDWARVKAAKTMLFGASLDNAPFDMYNPQFQPDGFDIALAAELARRMGVKATFKNYAFDGLLNALQLNKIDAVISSMAITPDRQQVADFTLNYYRGEDAVLAAWNSPINAVKTQADLAQYRVGVQRGTVFESFMQQNLVDTGQMPATNLQHYQTTSDAISDLQGGRIDLVLMDRLPAETYAAAGQARVVGQSMNVQEYAIAVRPGSTLLPELNQALAEVQADGTLARLAEQYLAVPAGQAPPLPTPTATPVVPPTAAPTATLAPTPTPAPMADMAYVADLTLDDKNHAAIPVVQPGQSLHKGWRIQNTGTLAWSPDFKLDFSSGDRMGGQPALMGQPVAIGATKDVYVDLAAPQAPGTYTGWWVMKDAAGKAFGEKIYVQVTVPGPPTPVPPPPTAVPSTSISFNVDRPQPVYINAGDCVNFSWSVTGVQAVYFCTNGSCKPEQGQGSEHVCPASTTTYELRVAMRDNTVQSRYITVNVQGQVSNLPSIQYLNADPGSIDQGQCTTLSWGVQGATSRVALVRNGYPLEDGNRANGSRQDCGAPAGTLTYELQAWGPNGSGPVKRQTQVQVHQNQPPPCQPRTLSAGEGNCGQAQNMQICDTLIVTLQVNGGAGYSWTATDYADNVLSFQGGGDQQCGGGPGAPCTYRWQYHGANSGSGQLSYVLRGPGGTESQQCNFPVNVR